MRNPYAKALRVSKKTYREHLDETLAEEIPEEFLHLLSKLK